uniref:Dolichyl-diphosphooligosaccharide--protein glycosyltransferase subunit DAD1 n=1 Tax=Aceria tosichella TaxID=561515 RepID=A0A6G1SIH9_9ACAR
MSSTKSSTNTTHIKPKDLVVDFVDLKDPINVYLATVFATGVIQFIYILLVGTFPFNSFLAGFLSCVTSFVLAVCLKKTGDFKGFLFAHLVLHLSVLMLIG